MEVIRGGLAGYEGFTKDDVGVFWARCPECKGRVLPGPDQLAWFVEGDRRNVEVACNRCFCVFRLEKRKEE